jgi:hypothetical protein
MQAVWSFWSKPFQAGKGRVWTEPKHHLQAWGLSLRLARQHFPETILVTDSPGKTLLVDTLGLEFTQVSTQLDRLRDVDPDWWALGKLVAYSLQDKPFIHLDTDVFLWRPLPAPLLAAPVFAQSPERHSLLDPWCGLRRIERFFKHRGDRLPVEWEWASSRSTTWFREDNCGILGANRTDFIRYFAELAIDLVMRPTHVGIWAEEPDKFTFNMAIEQFLLGACVDYHRVNPASPFRGVTIRYLFENGDEPYNAEIAAKAGFTHLLGDCKAHPDVTARLERRIAMLDPGFHRHCERVAATLNSSTEEVIAGVLAHPEADKHGSPAPPPAPADDPKAPSVLFGRPR